MEPLDTGRGRRSVLAAIASGSVAAVGGCLGDGGTDDGAAENEDASTTDGNDDPPAFPDHPGEHPRDPPAGRRCEGPCGMEPADYPEWNAQIAHADGSGVFFDTPGCLVTYAHDPAFYDGPDSPIESVWVRDFGTKELLDAAETVFVLDYDRERLEEPMAHNPKPFADRADAVDYVESYDDLSSEDIVSLGAFGAEQANRYRDYPLPDEE